jgi:hypothetical protein
MKEVYGAGIMFFYFLKWPIILGLPWLYANGLQDNIILNILWIYCILLVCKDIFMFIKKRKESKNTQKEHHENTHN